MVDLSLWDTDDNRTRFAMAVIRKGATLAAGLEVFPHDTVLAMRVTKLWPSDDFVRSEIDRLTPDVKATSIIPTKEDMILELWAIGQDAAEDRDRITAIKQAAELAGYVEKPSAANVNVSLTTNKVMMVPYSRTDEEWEIELEEQQRKLIEHV